MPTRSRMTHRCTIERNLTPGVDSSGNELAPVWGSHIVGQPCYWFQPKIGPGELQGEVNVNVYGSQLLVPWNTDIRESDRVNGIKDRRGDYLTEETFGVVYIIYKPDHLLITLELVK